MVRRLVAVLLLADADYRVLGPGFFALATSVDARLVPAGAGRSAPLARMAPSPWRCSGGRAGMVAVEGGRSIVVMGKTGVYFGIMVTMTRLYRDRGGFPLSVTRRMKCAVSSRSTSGAMMYTPRAFSAELVSINFRYVPASG